MKNAFFSKLSVSELLLSRVNTLGDAEADVQVLAVLFVVFAFTTCDGGMSGMG